MCVDAVAWESVGVACVRLVMVLQCVVKWAPPLRWRVFCPGPGATLPRFSHWPTQRVGVTKVMRWGAVGTHARAHCTTARHRIRFEEAMAAGERDGDAALAQARQDKANESGSEDEDGNKKKKKKVKTKRPKLDHQRCVCLLVLSPVCLSQPPLIQASFAQIGGVDYRVLLTATALPPALPPWKLRPITVCPQCVLPLLSSPMHVPLARCEQNAKLPM